MATTDRTTGGRIGAAITAAATAPGAGRRATTSPISLTGSSSDTCTATDEHNDDGPPGLCRGPYSLPSCWLCQQAERLARGNCLTNRFVADRTQGTGVS